MYVFVSVCLCICLSSHAGNSSSSWTVVEVFVLMSGIIIYLDGGDQTLEKIYVCFCGIYSRMHFC